MSAITQLFPVPEPATDNYLVIDIETSTAPEHVIAQMIAGWEPPANIKDAEKIQERREKYATEAKAKSALTDAAPIVTIAAKGLLGATQVQAIFHSFGSGEGFGCPALKQNGWTVLSFDDSKAMLQAFGQALDNLANEATQLVGHNILNFDLPKLRLNFVKSGLPLPLCLQPRDENQPVYDTQRHAKYFSIEASNQPFYSFKKLEKALGIADESHKDIMSGAEVPTKCEEIKAAIAASDLATAQSIALLICAYNARDVVQEEKAFRLMTGRY